MATESLWWPNDWWLIVMPLFVLQRRKDWNSQMTSSRVSSSKCFCFATNSRFAFEELKLSLNCFISSQTSINYGFWQWNESSQQWKRWANFFIIITVNDVNLCIYHFLGLSEKNELDSLAHEDSNVILNIEKPKSGKRGIVFLGHIPEGLNPKSIRLLLSPYGEIERIYLDKDKSPTKNGNKSSKRSKYVEGWVEFKKKSIAKMVASTLNGTPISGKRQTRYYGALWNLKYLKRYCLRIYIYMPS